MSRTNSKALLAAFAFSLLSVLPVHTQPQPGTVLWSFTCVSQITTSPAIAPDGAIYIGSTTALYAITNAGSNKWTFAAPVSGSASVGADGSIYFGGSGRFRVLSPDGAEKWNVLLS